MSIVERECDLSCQLYRYFDRESSLSLELIVKRLPSYMRHGVPQLPTGLAGVEHGYDMRMLETRGKVDLTQEALGPQGVQLGTHDLQGDTTIVSEVVCEIDRCHTALSELALETVAIRQGGLEIVRGAGQSQRSWVGLRS
jgi:hypothetical protein